MRINVLRSIGVLGLAAGALMASALTPAAAATAGPGQGSAFGASANVSLLPGVLNGITVNTGELAPSSSSGRTSNSVADVSLKGLVTASAISSSSVHDTATGDVKSKASIVDATLPVLQTVVGSTPSASVISATCTSTASGITGSSEIVGLKLGALGTVPVNAPANTTLADPLGLVKVIVNEQVTNADGSLTVNALHIKLLGGSALGAVGTGDIVLSSATCGKATTPPSAPAPAPGPGQVSVVPAGAPQTGDGSLATVFEN